MDRVEKNALTLAIALLPFFFVLIVYEAKGLKIDLPTCITDVQPFKEGKLIKHADRRYELHLRLSDNNREPEEDRKAL